MTTAQLIDRRRLLRDDPDAVCHSTHRCDVAVVERTTREPDVTIRDSDATGGLRGQMIAN